MIEFALFLAAVALFISLIAFAVSLNGASEDEEEAKAKRKKRRDKRLAKLRQVVREEVAKAFQPSQEPSPPIDCTLPHVGLESAVRCCERKWNPPGDKIIVG